MIFQKILKSFKNDNNPVIWVKLTPISLLKKFLYNEIPNLTMIIK